MERDSSNDQGLEDIIRSETKRLKHYVQTLQLSVHHFYIFGEIEDDINIYSDLLHVLKTSSEDDTVVLYINSEGGSLRMAIQIVNSMLTSRANVVTVLDGDAYSAATVIFMAGKEYIINPNCSFMIHNYSAGFIGKGHEIRTRVDHVNDQVAKMMRTFYEKILSEDEIDDVIAGRDIWMDSDELIARLDKVEEEIVKESVPKPKATKKKVKKKVSKKS